MTALTILIITLLLLGYGFLMCGFISVVASSLLLYSPRESQEQVKSTLTRGFWSLGAGAVLCLVSAIMVTVWMV